MQIGGNTIIRLRKEKDQLIEENKQIKEMVGRIRWKNSKGKSDES